MAALDWLGGATCTECSKPVGECRCGVGVEVEGHDAPAAREKEGEIMGGKKAADAAAEIATEYIHGIEASKLDGASIDAAIKKLKLTVGKKAKLPEKVEALKSHFAKVKLPPGSVLAPCTKCGAASSTHDFDSCPFCGDADEPSEGQAAAPSDTPPPPDTGTRAIVPVKPAEPATEAVAIPLTELDERVAEIRQINRNTMANVYLLASKITEIEKSEVWKQRMTTDGKVAYSKFEDFAKAELDMTRQYAQDLRRCFVNFKREEFEEHGVTKLRLLLQFPKDKQQEQLEKLRGGAGRREIEAEKKKVKKKNKPSKATPTSTITIASVEGSHKIRAHKKPAAKGDELVPAKRLADLPFGTLDLTNDVRLYITILPDAKGDLFFKVDFKRVAPVA